MTFQSMVLGKRRCQYQAVVMKTLEATRSRNVRKPAGMGGISGNEKGGVYRAGTGNFWRAKKGAADRR